MELVTGSVVEVKPLTKKMKDRVNSYGSQMRIVGAHEATIDGVQYDCYIESVSKSFRVGENLISWGGWVKVGRDCEFTQVLSASADK